MFPSCRSSETDIGRNRGQIPLSAALQIGFKIDKFDQKIRQEREFTYIIRITQ